LQQAKTDATVAEASETSAGHIKNW